jgi:hypothetical protein
MSHLDVDNYSGADRAFEPRQARGPYGRIWTSDDLECKGRCSHISYALHHRKSTRMLRQRYCSSKLGEKTMKAHVAVLMAVGM